MLLVLGSVCIGLGIGLLAPPRTTRYARPKVRASEWLVTGVALQVLASRLTGVWALALGLSALVVLVAFAVLNLHLTGMGVLTIGLCTNLVVMGANAGMPVSPRALVAADIVDAGQVEKLELIGPRHVERTGDTLLFLGDIIPMQQQVVSFGDLVIAVAAADVIAQLVRRQRPRQAARPASITTASPVHDWGIAPSPVPSSASQYSASPDDDAPRTLVGATSAPASHSR